LRWTTGTFAAIASSVVGATAIAGVVAVSIGGELVLVALHASSPDNPHATTILEMCFEIMRGSFAPNLEGASDARNFS
jgi:hypothetical protein